ncbi:hypothetical protein KFK09_010663 [Dendrobium nobile]|uniref:Uncharacterized protein n=1 Tax=Dendrobium nobile TaxID=94219 RepID=A0A8T3BCD8_DENNO|nr:hypothetical protein KFK09_010663 [Dendrobium nobile]
MLLMLWIGVPKSLELSRTRMKVGLCLGKGCKVSAWIENGGWSCIGLLDSSKVKLRGLNWFDFDSNPKFIAHLIEKSTVTVQTLNYQHIVCFDLRTSRLYHVGVTSQEITHPKMFLR